MDDLTAETLAEWRKAALTEHTVWGRSLDQDRMLTLLDALAEAMAERDELRARHARWREWDAEGLLYVIEEAERKYADLRAGVLRVADEFDSFGDYRTGDELRALDVKEVPVGSHSDW